MLYFQILLKNIVSILILMEVTLEEQHKKSQYLSLKGFNPYSNGSYSGSWIHRSDRISQLLFQSLF